METARGNSEKKWEPKKKMRKPAKAISKSGYPSLDMILSRGLRYGSRMATFWYGSAVQPGTDRLGVACKMCATKVAGRAGRVCCFALSTRHHLSVGIICVNMFEDGDGDGDELDDPIGGQGRAARRGHVGNAQIGFMGTARLCIADSLSSDIPG